jgi:hypothetical protein
LFIFDRIYFCFDFSRFTLAFLKIMRRGGGDGSDEDPKKSELSYWDGMPQQHIGIVWYVSGKFF